MQKKLNRTKLCRVCRTSFSPRSSTQVVCGWECAFEMTVQTRIKTERKETRDAKLRLKSRADWAREAQSVVNKYVRLRDAKLGCCSCDKPTSWDGQWHASHFRSVGAAPQLRFNLWNIHKSCSVCNNWLSGNLIEYEPRLRIKIGDSKVDWLRNYNQRSAYSIDYLIRLIKIFKKKTNRLANKV